MKLTTKQELFVNEYMKDGNATASAIRSGYSERSANNIGPDNLLKPIIRDEIDKRLKERTISNGITVDFVLNSIKDISINGKRESDRIKALELLGKCLKLFTDKIESTNINHSLVDDVRNMTDEEIEAELEMLNKIMQIK
jgi:phage terminase small subunit